MKNKPTETTIPTKTKEEIDRGIEIRSSMLSELQRDISHAELQRSFSKEGSAEYKYYSEEIASLKRLRTQYNS